MEYLSAPWREEYVKRVFKMNECILCRALKLKKDKEAYILFRGTYNFILLNKYPYTPSHLMIAPYKHLASFERAKKEATDEMVDLAKISLKILKKQYKPHGFNTGMNLGASAGAGVVDHYHLHVIPRWTGDSNFMPLVGKTRLTIEDLDTTYERLFPFFQKEKKTRTKN
ncbi:MAG: HIT domain-containing protein [Candidatus Aminicenantes bacterium]|nr:MAG: HIT domain-containing protein [Candidatus Aminicenantes bacterium]